MSDLPRKANLVVQNATNTFDPVLTELQIDAPLGTSFTQPRSS